MVCLLISLLLSRALTSSHGEPNSVSGFVVWKAAGWLEFESRHRVQTGYSEYPLCTGDSSRGDKAVPGSDADWSPPCSTEITGPAYLIMMHYLGTQQTTDDSATFPRGRCAHILKFRWLFLGVYYNYNQPLQCHERVIALKNMVNSALKNRQ
jgi:hypothetical protein